MVSLSPRLLAVATLIPPGARLVDVGADHGRLPAYLVQRGLVSSVLATDISPEALAKARQLIDRCGLSRAITFRLADGLGGLPLDDFDVVVMAGLGADTIVDIWRKNPPPTHITCLLSPMSHTERLRAFLGNSILLERLVLEGRRLYSVLAAKPQEAPKAPVEPGRRYVSQALEQAGDPLLPLYLERQIARLVAEGKGLAVSRRKGDDLRRAETAEALAYMRTLRRNRYKG